MLQERKTLIDTGSGGSDPKLISVVVWDNPGTPHANAVMEAVVQGYQEESLRVSVVTENRWSSIENMILNNGVEAVVRPYAGFNQNDVIRAQKFYPETLFFHALHNNEFKQMFTFKDWHPPCVCVFGAGDIMNNTCYGNGLEFWDYDFVFDPNDPDQASFSMGFGCGRLLRLRDELKLKYNKDISWWTTRFIMRRTCVRDEPNRTGDDIWCLYNGYGRPVWQQALRYSNRYMHQIPQDPYIIGLGVPGNIKALLFGLAELELPEIASAVIYEVIRNEERVYIGNKRFLQDTLKIEGVYDYKYRGIDKYGNETEWSEVKKVIYLLQKGF